MTFQPIIIANGFAGWAALKRSMPAQKAVFNKDAELSRDIDYFKKNIVKVKTANDLVSDRRLLQVALGAFGLQEDIGNKFFLEKVLSEGVSTPKALANKLSDKRYAAFSEAFNFDSVTGANTKKLSFINEVVTRFQDQSFEVAVGAQDPNMRLAMGVARGLEDVTEGTSNGDAHWFRAMGSPSLRKVLESALGLPKSMGNLPIDSQLVQFKNRAKKVFGTDKLSEIKESPDLQEKLTRSFLVRSQLQGFSIKAQQSESALSILSQIRFPDISIY